MYITILLFTQFKHFFLEPTAVFFISVVATIVLAIAPEPLLDALRTGALELALRAFLVLFVAVQAFVRAVAAVIIEVAYPVLKIWIFRNFRMKNIFLMLILFLKICHF